jgi:hypothetical protein
MDLNFFVGLYGISLQLLSLLRPYFTITLSAHNSLISLHLEFGDRVSAADDVICNIFSHELANPHHFSFANSGLERF